MKPTDIDGIANAVVGTLAGSQPGLLGCSSLSSTAAFDVDNLDCFIQYVCGGDAAFRCLFEFDCGSGPGPFYCGSSPLANLFQCPRIFGCDPQVAFF